MIERVTVKNYVSVNVDADVVLGRVTVILGPNDHGKSALLRALRAVAEAQSGTSFILTGTPRLSRGPCRRPQDSVGEGREN